MPYEFPTVLGRVNYPTRYAVNGNGLAGLGDFDYGDETLDLPGNAPDAPDAQTPTDDYGNPTGGVVAPTVGTPPLGVPTSVLADIYAAQAARPAGLTFAGVNAAIQANAKPLLIGAAALIGLKLLFGGRGGRR